MLLGDTPIENLELLQTLAELGSYSPLENILEEVTLTSFQTATLAYSYFSKSSVARLDTGLGKTLVAIGFSVMMKKLHNGVTLFLSESGNLEQTKAKFIKHSKLRVVAVDGKKETIMSVISQPMIYDVYIVSYECMRNFMFNQFLVLHLSKLKALVVDESQNLGNLSSDITQLMMEVCKHIEFRLFLTATTLRSKVEQYVNMLHVLDSTYVGNPNKLLNEYRDVSMDGDVVYHDLEDLAEETSLKVINVSRNDLGIQGNYKPFLISGEPTNIERRYKSNQRHLLKSRVDSDIMNRLITILVDLKFRNKYGIIYCNTNSNKAILYKALTDAGFNVGIRDGYYTKTKEDKLAVTDKFAKREIDCLITNSRTGLDLQCDYIVLWEQTSDFFQTIGRGERGLQGNDLEIYMCIVKHSVDVKYFRQKIKPVAEYLGELLGKDVSIIDKFDAMITQAEIEDGYE